MIFLSRSEDLRNQTFTLGRAKREKNEFAIFSSLMRIMRFAKNYKILHNWLDSAQNLEFLQKVNNHGEKLFKNCTSTSCKTRTCLLLMLTQMYPNTSQEEPRITLGIHTKKKRIQQQRKLDGITKVGYIWKLSARRGITKLHS